MVGFIICVLRCYFCQQPSPHKTMPYWQWQTIQFFCFQKDDDFGENIYLIKINLRRLLSFNLVRSEVIIIRMSSEVQETYKLPVEASLFQPTHVTSFSEFASFTQSNSNHLIFRLWALKHSFHANPLKNAIKYIEWSKIQNLMQKSLNLGFLIIY